MYKKRFLQTLGLSKRASALLSGDELFKSLSKGGVYLVVLASDASDRSKKQYRDKSSTYGISLVEEFTSAEISNACGLKNRIAVGITNDGIAQKLYTYTKEEVTQ